jgi:hypothetical protein
MPQESPITEPLTEKLFFRASVKQRNRLMRVCRRLRMKQADVLRLGIDLGLQNLEKARSIGPIQ